MRNSDSIEERVLALAERGAAKRFGVSKSTVHKDITQRLMEIDPILGSSVRKILDENKAERHIRGGMATKLKYIKLKEKNKLV